MKDVNPLDVVKELSRVYLLHPQAVDFEINPDEKYEVVSGMILEKIKELIPEGYEIVFTPTDEDNDDLKIALAGEIEFQEFTIVYAKDVQALKKSSPKVYRFMCRVIGHLLHGGLPNTTDFVFFDECYRMEVASENPKFKTKKQVKAQVAKEKEEWEKSVSEFMVFMKECRKFYKLKAQAPKCKNEDLKNLVALGESILDSPSSMGDFLETVTSKGNGSCELTPDHFILLGFSPDSVLDEEHTGNVDSHAREGVLSPYHLVRLDNKESWKVEYADYGFISRYAFLADQLRKLNPVT